MFASVHRTLRGVRARRLVFLHKAVLIRSQSVRAANAKRNFLSAMKLQHILSGRLLVTNTLRNTLAQAMPLLVGIAVLPSLIHGLGNERFGILGLAWAIIGYFSLFDLGLGRALTKLVAGNLGNGKPESIAELVWTALILMVGAGTVGMFIMLGFSHWVVWDALNVPLALRPETLRAFYLLSLSIPLTVCAVGLRGVLEGYQRFDLIIRVRIPLGLLTFLGPLAVLPFTRKLDVVVFVLLIGRGLALLAYYKMTSRVVCKFYCGTYFQPTVVRALLSFGGWIAISNLVGPILMYSDRFMIGTFLSMKEVAFYVTPYEVITKFLIIPVAVLGVLFPAFSHFSLSDSVAAQKLYNKALIAVFCLMLPVVLGLIVYGDSLLTIWLDSEYAEKSFRVAQILLVGVLVNAQGLVSQAFVQALGRPDWTGKLHLAELPIFFVYFPLLLKLFGLEGAAVGWLVRVSISAVILSCLARKVILGEAVVLK